MLSSLDRAALHFGLESLEQRRMLAVSTAIDNTTHTLVINGTPSSDSIVVNKLSNGKVSVNGGTQYSTGTTSGKFNKITIKAGNGNDFVQINNNVPYVSSSIIGSKGNDTLRGGVGNDVIHGDDATSAGSNDTLSGGGGGADSLIGDGGFDTADYSDRTDNLNISLDGAANDGATNEKDNVQTEEVISGSGNDTLTGSGADDFLDGGAGADVIDGQAGDDDVIGSAGTDKLLGGADDDLIQAKDGQVDQVSGGSNSGSPTGDLAAVDSIDVPAVPKPAKHPSLAPGGGGPSDIDTTYGTNGIAIGPDQGWDDISASAVDSQGRVVFVGSDLRFHGNGYGEDMVATRYKADGTLDTGFGYNGEADINFPVSGTGYGSVSDDFGYGVAIGSGDSIVIVGSNTTTSGASRNIHTNLMGPTADNSNFAVAKLDETGHLDGGFGNGGLTTSNLTVDSNDEFGSIARDVAIQNDGSIVVAGDRTRQNQEVTYDPAAEFSPDGNPNGSWSYGFSANLNDPATLFDTPKHLEDGRDLWTSSTLVSSSTNAPDVEYNGTDSTAGGLDPGELALEPGFYGQFSHVTFTAQTAGSYDINGTFASANSDVEAPTATTDVHVFVNGESQFDGEVNSESTSQDFSLPGFFLNVGDTIDFVVGYGSNNNFNDDATSLSAEVDRTSAPDDQTFAVARYSDTGDLDQTFNDETGFNTIDVGNGETVSSVALQNLPDDFGAQRIVVGGSADGNFVVSRFLADGTVDFDFGDSGGYTSTSIETDATLNDVAVDADNNIYAVGNAFTTEIALRPDGEPADATVAILAKYDSNGDFIGNIEESTGDTSQGDTYNAVTVDPSGRILAAGSDGQDYLIGRYNNDLNFDTTFASGPVTYDLAPQNSLGSSDTAQSITVLGNNNIIAAGQSNYEDQFEAGHFVTSAIRLVGDQEPANQFDIETFIDNFDNPPPEVQQHLDDLSPTALLFLESAPDANGNVKIDTHNSGGDKITLKNITAGDGSVVVAVTVNGLTTFFDFATTNSITIITDGGADSIIADPNVTTRLIIQSGEGDDTVTGGSGTNFIFGGGGNDKLNGGSKADVIVGGAGRDSVFGNNGNDIVIGGPNNDSVSGGNGEDIVIAGTTAYDSDQSALSALLAEWSSTHSNATRISNIRSGTNGGANDPFYFSTTGSDKTIFDDSAKDTLSGGANRDWFFRKNSGPNKDTITDGITSGGSVEEFTNI